MNQDFDEPLLTESKNRHVMFPVEYPDIFEMYKKHVSTFWTADELNFQQDLIDLEKLTSNEKYFINHVLAFFAASDGIVSENLGQRFSNDVPKAEVRAFYAFQNAMEQVHSESYSLLIDSYVKDPVEKDSLFNAVRNFPAIKEKSDWCQKWITDILSPFSQRLVAFAIVEGVFFSLVGFTLDNYCFFVNVFVEDPVVGVVDVLEGRNWDTPRDLA
jgi:ribonucleotide reductase beta subunit family protein with ferritin-like domain